MLSVLAAELEERGGGRYLTMEVSSHGLALARVYGELSSTRRYLFTQPDARSPGLSTTPWRSRPPVQAPAVRPRGEAGAALGDPRSLTIRASSRTVAGGEATRVRSGTGSAKTRHLRGRRTSARVSIVLGTPTWHLHQGGGKRIESLMAGRFAQECAPNTFWRRPGASLRYGMDLAAIAEWHSGRVRRFRGASSGPIADSRLLVVGRLRGTNRRCSCATFRSRCQLASSSGARRVRPRHHAVLMRRRPGSHPKRPVEWEWPRRS